jgi:hypothetical protein
MTVTSSTLSYNLISVEHLPYPYGGFGGGIYSDSTSATVTDSILNFNGYNGPGNTYPLSGGGICNGGTHQGSGTVGGEMTVTGCDLNYDIASYGIGIANYGTITISNTDVDDGWHDVLALIGGEPGNCSDVGNLGGTMTVTNCTISGDMLGMGISNDPLLIPENPLSPPPFTIYPGTLTVTDSNISSNRYGGIYNGQFDGTNCTMTVTDCDFSDNVASYGGAITNFGTSTISGCTFSDNWSPGAGGAIYNAINTNTSVTYNLQVSSSNFYGNWGYNGGCIMNQGDLLLTTSDVSGDAAWYGFAEGAGVENSGGSAVISSCTISNNNGYYGGGIYTSGGELSVTNSTLFGNTAYEGGGIYGSGTDETVTACTIDGNAAAIGGGIYSDNVILDSSIVAGNTATSVPYDYPDIDSTVSSGSSYNLIGSNAGVTGTLNSTNQHGTNSSPLNPLLYPLGYYGGPTPTMPLLSESPAHNTGDPSATNHSGSTLTVDQRGFARPHGSGATPDVGAFESQTYTHFEINVQQYSAAGNSVTFTVAAVDQFDNLDSAYTGTVHFSSSDGAAALPANSTLTSGVGTFTVTFNTGGNQTIVATDTSTSSITGSSTVSVSQTNFVVTNTSDSGTGSLRWAVGEADASTVPTTITFSSSFFSTAHTITLSSPLTLTDSAETTIVGPGASLLTISGDDSSQAFIVTELAVAAIGGVTITEGVAPTGQDGGAIVNTGYLTLTNDVLSYNSAWDGGAILNSGTLVVSGSTLNENTAAQGGGILNGGTLSFNTSTIENSSGNGIFNAGTESITGSTLNNNTESHGAAIFNTGKTFVTSSTLANNTSSDTGGAIDSDGSLTVNASTISANSATINGSGIFSDGTLSMDSTIVAGNTSGTANVWDTSITDSHCLLSGSPGLNSLASNGGPTETMSLQVGSAALNNGDPSVTGYDNNLLTTDQRGYWRPTGSGATPDIGAYETQTHTVTVHLVVSTPATVVEGEAFTFTVTAENSGGSIDTSYTGTVAITSSDGAASLPGTYTFTSGDAGVHTFTITLNSIGWQGIAATDTTSTAFPGFSSLVYVQPDFIVTSTADPSPDSLTTGTLRWAVYEANNTQGPSTITFSSEEFSTYQTIKLLYNTLILMNPSTTTIQGPQNDALVTLNANLFQGFSITSGASASISGLTISNAADPTIPDLPPASGPGGSGGVYYWYWQDGGAISNAGTLTLSNCAFSTDWNGGLYNVGTLTMSGINLNENSGDGIFNAGTLAMTDSTVGNNTYFSMEAVWDGYGIYSSGTMTISDSVVCNSDLGGISNTGEMAVTNTTVSGNSSIPYDGGIIDVADYYGGGINNCGIMALTSSTISGNYSYEGGGIFNSGTMNLDSNIVAGNSYSPDFVGGAYVTSAYNIIGNGSTITGTCITNGTNNNQVGTSGSPINPELNVLANYGGPTESMVLLSTSPALNTGDPNALDPYGNLLPTDQRGFSRPNGSGATPDVGAVENQGANVATHFAVSAPSTATAGTSFSVTVTAEDDFNNTATSYSGTADLTSTDLGFSHSPITLSSGTYTFSATLYKAGNQTITATDPANALIWGSSSTIDVSAGALTHFVITGTPSSVSPGTFFSFTVTAEDAYGNMVTGFSGSVNFTSTDSSAMLPPFGSLSSGVGTFSAQLYTPGIQYITVIDSADSSITGTSSGIDVT